MQTLPQPPFFWPTMVSSFLLCSMGRTTGGGFQYCWSTGYSVGSRRIRVQRRWQGPGHAESHEILSVRLDEGPGRLNDEAQVLDLSSWVNDRVQVISQKKIWKNRQDFIIHWFQVCQLNIYLNMLKTRNFLSGLTKSCTLHRKSNLCKSLKTYRKLMNQ